MGWLLAWTCIFLVRAVWVRRWTLLRPTEQSKLTERTLTASLLCQLAALFLMSPLSAHTVGRFLHAVTGQWNLDSWAGHCCYIGAAGLIAVNAASRLDITRDHLRHAFHQRFELPMTVIVPVLLGLLVMSPNASQDTPDMFVCKPGPWLNTYWTLLCGFLIFLLVNAICALRVIRRDPRNRWTATAYMTALGVGCAACALRIVTCWANMPIDFSPYFWIAGCVAGQIFSIAAAQSWRKKIRQLKEVS